MSELVQTYEQTLEFLFDRVNFERTPAGGKQDKETKTNHANHVADAHGKADDANHDQENA